MVEKLDTILLEESFTEIKEAIDYKNIEPIGMVRLKIDSSHNDAKNYKTAEEEFIKQLTKKDYYCVLKTKIVGGDYDGWKLTGDGFKRK